MTTKVINCIVFGRGEPITVALPADVKVNQLRNTIKMHKDLPRDSELDLYRAYDTVTNKWHAVTAVRARELGALTNQAKIAKAVAGCNLMHPFHQLCSVDFNLPEEFEEGVIHVLAVVSIGPAAKVVNCIVLGRGEPITVTLPAGADVIQLRQTIKTRKGLHWDSELNLYQAFDTATNKWRTMTEERVRELGALTNQTEIMQAVAGCSMMNPFHQLCYFKFNLPEEYEEGVIHVLGVVSMEPAERVIKCIVLGHGEPITVTLPANTDVIQLRQTIKTRKGLHWDSELNLYQAFDTATNKWHTMTAERARELGALTNQTEIMRVVAGCNAMDPYFHLHYFKFNVPEESVEGIVHVLAVTSLAPVKMVVNCVVLGRGDIIRVTLPAEFKVDELRKTIKAHKFVSRHSQLDLYRAYDTTTNKWLEVTTADARALGALTDQAEIARVVAGFAAIDPFLQLCSSKLDFPEKYQGEIVHILALVSAPPERKRFRRSIQGFLGKIFTTNSKGSMQTFDNIDAGV